MSSAISIAAQDPNNINEVEAIGFKTFNRNIISRFTKHENLVHGRQKDAAAAKLKLQSDIKDYTNKQRSLNYYLYKLNLGQFVEGSDYLGRDDGTVPLITHNVAIQTAKHIADLRRTIHDRYPLSHDKAGQYRPNTTHEQSRNIPLNINILMDGIAGTHPYRMFRVAKNRLPISYRRDDIGF